MFLYRKKGDAIKRKKWNQEILSIYMWVIQDVYMVIKIDTTKEYGIDIEKVVEGDFLGQS